MCIRDSVSTASSQIHTAETVVGGLSDSAGFGPALLTGLITAWAVWHWSGRWWALVASFMPQLTFAEIEPSYFVALPLLGLLLYTLFVPPGEYALHYPDDPPHPKQKWWVEVATLVLLALRPLGGIAAAVVIWFRSTNKWLVAGLVAAGMIGYLFLPSGITEPLLSMPAVLTNPILGWSIFAGIVLLWVGIGQRDVLISAASTAFFLPTLSWGILLTPAVVLAVRLPLFFIALNLIIWGLITFATG